MSIEERLAAAERRIAQLERRLGPEPISQQPLTLPPTGIPPTHPWPNPFRDAAARTRWGEWPHNAGSRA